MRITIALCLFLAAPAWAALPPAISEEAPQPASDDPDRDRIVRLQEAVYNIVHGGSLGKVRVGVHLADLKTGRTFYQSNASALMDPASNQKVFATAAALLRLGNDFRFRTEVQGPDVDEQGLVQGDVILRGSGDPSLEMQDLDSLAARLVARGITRITGDVVADPRGMNGADPTALGRSPLQVRHSSIVIRIRPGARPGAAPIVMLQPLERSIAIQNRARTRAGGRTRITVAVVTERNRLVVNVKGNISMRHPGVVFRKRPQASMLYAAFLLQDALVRQGVTVDGQPRVGQIDAAKASAFSFARVRPSIVLAAHNSQRLPDLLATINKTSNNDYADRLLETLGSEVEGGAPSMQKGVAVLRGAMDDLGIDRSLYHPVNGSGLGHQNRVTPSGMVTLLRSLYFDPRIGAEMLQSLSVGGIDGTTRSRFRNSSAFGRVRAKTGTLNGKSILSGYVGERDAVVFSILVDRIRRRGVAPVRSGQIRIVEALMSYVKGGTGLAPAEEIEPGVDPEIEDESTDGEPEDAIEDPAASNATDADLEALGGG
jgi:serine-type D-Ala-D-Ala carboxypeptidase/endopeptidase (penicillin-binding protein 4)